MFFWIKSNFDPLLIGLITGLICSFIPWLVSKVYWFFRIRKSAFSGIWKQYIYKDDDVEYKGKIIKHDIYKVKHKKLKYSGKLVINMEGRIKRIFPEARNQREWDFMGYLNGDVLTILYQAKEGQKSRGCIYVKLSRNSEFRGFYLSEHEDGRITKSPVIIKKEDI